ncbi:MAG TPA: ABC transporter ATP-binding protein [Gemmatimonadaceae bacterium]|nr:ABC transporter ATP-binding protein [Gemmatimonadaceae bacterium]
MVSLSAIAVAAPSSAAIRLGGVSKSFASASGATVHALAPIDLTVARGSFTSVVGRSGCGKSTLLRLVAGLETPSGGEVAIDGAAVSGPAASVRYVFQNYGESLLPWLTVGQNVRFGLRHAYRRTRGSKAEQHAEVERLLDEVGLSGTADRYPYELSGGMQQRVAIARALASRPSILLLDEPFSAVDALSRATLQDLVLRVWREHELTVVFVTHDIDEALYLSDRVVVLGAAGRGIRRDVHVGLERPRDQVATRENAEFLALRREVLGLVLEEER